MKLLRFAWFSLALLAWAAAASAADPEFGSFWHDGKAELDGYRLSIQRYGQPRAGQAMMIYVTEPFRTSARVKADDPAKNPADVFDALKLNLVRDFQTGIYDYNTMASLFVRSDTFEPVKLTFSSAEWCGHVYEELLVDPQRIRQQLSSYFEGESASGTFERPAGGILEDELFVRLRGLRGDSLRPGTKRTLPLLPSALWRRLVHRPPVWATAEIERLASPQRIQVPAGTFSTRAYVVRTGDGREGRFFVDDAYPHRIVKWTWRTAAGASAPGEGLDSGELAGTQRLEYWKLHGNGDESWLGKLGIAPTVAPRAR